MQIIAHRSDRYVYPPTGRIINTPKPASSFEQHQIKSNFPTGIRLRPKGVRQSLVEARILGTIKAIVEGRAYQDGDWLNRG